MTARMLASQKIGWTPAMTMLALAVAVGLLGRVWVVLYGPGHAFAVDQLFDTLAWNLLSLREFSLDGVHPAAHVGPLYPMVLAWFYAMVGHHPEWVPVLHIAMDGATAWCVYRIGGALYGSWVGACAAALFLIYPAYWTYDARIRSEALFTFLMSAWVWAAVLCVQRQSVRQYALAGLLAGLTILCKPVVLILAVFLVGLVWTGTESPLHKVTCAGVYVLAGLVLVLPWTVRNYSRFHEVIPVSAGMGAGLWMGSDPLSRGSWPMTHQQETAIWESAGLTPLPYAHAMYDVQTDRLLREKGWARIAGDPIGYVRLIAIRVWDFWVGNPLYLLNSDNDFANGLRADAADRGWLVAGFSLAKRLVLVPGLIVLALWSGWRDRERWREWLPLCLFPLGLTAGYVPFTVEAGRYALPVLPCLIVLSTALGLRFVFTRSLLGRTQLWSFLPGRTSHGIRTH